MIQKRSKGRGENRTGGRANIRKSDRLVHRLWVPGIDGAGTFQGAFGCVSQDEGEKHISSASYPLTSEPTDQGGSMGANSGIAYT